MTLLAAVSASGAQTAPQAEPMPPNAAALPVALNSCSTLRVAMTEAVSSADAHPGDVFHFKSLEPIEVNHELTLPPDAEGVGVVSLAQHADRGGKGGFLALDPRYIKLPDGKEAQVLVDRTTPVLAPTGKSNNIPGYAGMIPFAGWVLGPYAFLHHGSDITVPKGASFRVFIGDLETVSRCRANAKPQKRAG